MSWILLRTNTFLESLRQFKHNKDLLLRTRKETFAFRKNLSVPVAGYPVLLKEKNQPDLSGKYRLIFTPIESEHKVYLNWIDHPSVVYE